MSEYGKFLWKLAKISKNFIFCALGRLKLNKNIDFCSIIIFKYDEILTIVREHGFEAII